MKEIRNLLLLLLAIVSQGAWAQTLLLGENTIDVAESSNEKGKWGDYQPGAYQNFSFAAEHTGELIIRDITDVDNQVLDMINNGGGSYSPWTDDNGKSCLSIEVEEGNTYTIGIREYSEGRALQNVKLLLEMECTDHHYDTNGNCTTEWCSKQIRKLTEGLNSGVDCSYSSDRYLFIPETSGKLKINAKDEYDENVNLVYSLYDEEGTLVYTNYVASAPMHKVAKHSPGSGCIVEAHNKYLFDFSNNYGGEYDITINVSNGPDEIDGCFEISYYDGELVEENLSNTCEYIYQQAGLGSYDGTSSFIALNGVYYERKSTTSRWGTVVLPFELQSNDDVTYYVLSDVSGENMTFTPVETVPANNPAVYRFNNEADSYQYCILTADPTRIDIPEQLYVNCETGLDDWSMVGFYVQEVVNYDNYSDDYADILASIRYISKDKFMTATNSLTIKPYRAIFQYGGEDPSMAKTFTLSIDGEADGIQAIMTEDGIEEVEAIYDLNGRKLDNMKSGVNIVRTADGEVHKIIKK